jgi:electron transfer flavoprotein alpha/beta subunit
MKLIVCLETLPDPDCVVQVDGNFDYEHCHVRLDAYSAKALEFALSLKDKYKLEVHSILLDSFEMESAYEEVKAAGSDSVEWIKVPFTYDPFKRAELFADAINENTDDIIISGYHCETCCTNSIPMLIALNKSLPYFSEISDINFDDRMILLEDYKTKKITEIKKYASVISVHTSRKLRYPSLASRIACREENAEPVVPEVAIKKEEHESIVSSSSIKTNQIEKTADSASDKAANLIELMDNRGMFQL